MTACTHQEAACCVAPDERVSVCSASHWHPNGTDRCLGTKCTCAHSERRYRQLQTQTYPHQYSSRLASIYATPDRTHIPFKVDVHIAPMPDVRCTKMHSYTATHLRKPGPQDIPISIKSGGYCGKRWRVSMTCSSGRSVTLGQVCSGYCDSIYKYFYMYHNIYVLCAEESPESMTTNLFPKDL